MRKLFILFTLLCWAVALNAQGPSETELWYTSSDGNVVIPEYEDHFGDATIVSNVYQDGKGIITFDRKLTCIGDYAFRGRDALTSIEMPNSVESIGATAFSGTALTSVTLPEGLEEIGANCFGDCSNLIYALFLGATPPTYDGVYPFAYSGKNVGGTGLLVPSGADEIYTAAGYTNVFTPTTFKSEILAYFEKTLNSDVPLSDADKARIDASIEIVNSATDIETIFNEYIKNSLVIGKAKALSHISTVLGQMTTEEKALFQDIIDKSIANIKAGENVATVYNELAELLNTVLEDRKYDAIYSVASLLGSLDVGIDYMKRIDDARSIEEIEAIVDEAKNYAAALISKRDEAEKILLSYMSAEEYKQKYKDAIYSKGIEEIDAIVNNFLNEIRRNNPCLEIGNRLYILKRGMSIGTSFYRYTYAIEDEFAPRLDIEWPDATEYHLPSDAAIVLFDQVKVIYNRTLPEGVWQCWYEPFRVEVDNSKFDAAEVAGILYNDEGEVIVAFRKLKDGAEMKGSTVYVIRAKEGHGELQFKSSDMWLVNNNKPLSIQSAYDTYTFYGVNTPKEHGDWYTLDKNGTFRQMASGNLKPQRFYMTITPREDDEYYPYPESSASTRGVVNYVVLGDHEPDGISPQLSTLNCQLSTAYDLQGHSTTSIRKGQIYIMNGKKYIGK